MNFRTKQIIWLQVCLAGFIFAAVPSQGDEKRLIPLSAPRLAGGKPLMQCLQERQSRREFSEAPLEPEMWSDLLWAAFGMNRGEEGKRTAPSTVNAQTLDIYMATSEGLFLYEARSHALISIHNRDIRPATGGQAYVRKAPVSLIYVADMDRLERFPEKEQLFYAAADTGFISQNVYLFSASENLATVVHAVSDNAALRKALALRPSQKPILAQCVGHGIP